MAKLHDDSGNISHTPYTYTKKNYLFYQQLTCKVCRKISQRKNKRLHFADSYKLDN